MMDSFEKSLMNLVGKRLYRDVRSELDFVIGSMYVLSNDLRCDYLKECVYNELDKYGIHRKTVTDGYNSSEEPHFDYDKNLLDKVMDAYIPGKGRDKFRSILHDTSSFMSRIDSLPSLRKDGTPSRVYTMYCNRLMFNETDDDKKKRYCKEIETELSTMAGVSINEDFPFETYEEKRAVFECVLHFLGGNYIFAKY